MDEWDHWHARTLAREDEGDDELDNDEAELDD